MRPTTQAAKTVGIDRRYIFAAMALAIAIPLLLPISFNAKPGAETVKFDRALQKAIDSPKPIMIGIDFGPQTMAELEPITLAVMHKIFHSRKKVIFFTLYPEAAALTRRYLALMEKTYKIEYGKDYVFLGYATAFTVAIYTMGTSIERFFQSDDKGTPLSQIPLMREVKNLKDASAVVDIAANNFPHQWISYAVAPYGIDFLIACTAVQATDYYPYLQTGQAKGMLAGGRAGAEYEALLMEQKVLTQTGDATRSLGSQTMALAAIALFIIVGNVGYFAGRIRSRKEMQR